MIKQQIGRFLNYYETYFALLLLFAVYVTDGINKAILIYGFAEPHVSKITKAILLLILIIVTLQRKSWPVFAVLLFFSVGQIALNPSFSEDSLTTLSKYFFTLLVITQVFTSDRDSQKKALFLKAFEWIMVINSIFILMGLFGDIYIFKTYFGTRFGYNGLFQNSATATYAYGLTLIYFLLKSGPELFKIPIHYIILISALFVGTKGIYLFIFLVLLIYVICYVKRRYVTYFLFLLAGAFVSLFYIIFFVRQGLFNELRSQTNLLSAVLSFRQDNLLNDTLPYIRENWNIINYLFGGVNDFSTRSEFGFIDTFYFFGIIGGVAYLRLYFISFLKTEKKRVFYFSLIAVTIVVFLAGNYFSYSSIVIYSIPFKLAASSNPGTLN